MLLSYFSVIKCIKKYMVTPSLLFQSSLDNNINYNYKIFMDIAESLKLDKCSYSNVCIIRMTESRLSIQFRNGYILQSMYIAGGVLTCTYVHSSRADRYLLSNSSGAAGAAQRAKITEKVHKLPSDSSRCPGEKGRSCKVNP